MDCIVGRAARSCALIGHPLTAGKAIVFSADQNAVDHVIDSRDRPGDARGQGPAAPVLDPPAELDSAAARRHGFDAEARQTGLGLESGFDRPSGSSRRRVRWRMLPQAAGGATKTGSAYASHPLAQGKPGYQPGPNPQAGPQEDLGPAQLISAHAYPLTEEIVLPLS